MSFLRDAKGCVDAPWWGGRGLLFFPHKQQQNQCCFDAGQTLNQHWFNVSVSGLLGSASEHSLADYTVKEDEKYTRNIYEVFYRKRQAKLTSS